MKRDRHIFQLIETEYRRQLKGIELIASENFVSDEVMKAMGSVLTNKYAEGYPGKRYYGGCEVIDIVEEIARERLKELYDAEWVNVQPHSGLRILINPLKNTWRRAAILKACCPNGISGLSI